MRVRFETGPVIEQDQGFQKATGNDGYPTAELMPHNIIKGPVFIIIIILTPA